MLKLLLLLFAVSFLSTYLMLPSLIKRMRITGLVGRDRNKIGQPEVAEMGGVSVLTGLILGILAYIGIKFFYYGGNDVTSLFAVLTTLLVIAIIGIMDDFFKIKGGLRQWQKPLLTLPAALPLMVVKAGTSTMILPILGAVDFGMLYSLVLVPIGVLGASNAVNMLAGYNGLEAGLGAVILATLGIVAYSLNSYDVLVLCICGLAALLAFLRFNWYPAKVFPGDILTYTLGALIACVVIVGNMERVGIILFTPFFIEFVLKTRSRFRAENFARVNKGNSLYIDQNYSVTHLSIKLVSKLKRKVYERDVVLAILAFEALIGILVLIQLIT